MCLVMMAESDVLEPLLHALDDLLLALLGQVVQFVVDSLLVLSQEGTHCLVVNQTGQS